MLDLESAIKHCEEVAEEQEKAAKEWHESEVRKCDFLPFAEMDYTHENECKECAAEHRQLAEWLKELKSFKEKDEPRIVLYEGDGYADGEWVYDYAYCPNCEHEFEEDSENWESEFCPNCGQRLRWEV